MLVITKASVCLTANRILFLNLYFLQQAKVKHFTEVQTDWASERAHINPLVGCWFVMYPSYCLLIFISYCLLILHTEQVNIAFCLMG